MSEDMAMEGKKRFVVSKPAEVWYSVVVEAGSEEEALAMAKHPSFDVWSFEVDWETFAWIDAEWEVYSDEEEGK